MVRILPEIQHNCCVKRYPDGGAEVIACEAAIFRERGWEAADKWAPEPRESASEAPDVAANLARAKRRARTMVRDYARANDFTHFVTLTLDASRVTNRYDIDACTRDIRVTLDNLVRRKGLQYVLVPEEHKDGAIHYHGFINAAGSRESRALRDSASNGFRMAGTLCITFLHGNSVSRRQSRSMESATPRLGTCASTSRKRSAKLAGGGITRAVVWLCLRSNTAMLPLSNFLLLRSNIVLLLTLWAARW